MNAKTALLELIGNTKIKCAEIHIWFEDTIRLKVGYSDKELEEFLLKVETFEYDECFGMYDAQSATIWLDDNSWIKTIFDGVITYFYHQELPEIPNELL